MDSYITWLLTLFLSECIFGWVRSITLAPKRWTEQTEALLAVKDAPLNITAELNTCDCGEAGMPVAAHHAVKHLFRNSSNKWNFPLTKKLLLLNLNCLEIKVTDFIILLLIITIIIIIIVVTWKFFSSCRILYHCSVACNTSDYNTIYLWLTDLVYTIYLLFHTVVFALDEMIDNYLLTN